MNICDYFPGWNKLTERQQRTITEKAIRKSATKGTVLHEGGPKCLGALLIRSGQLRAYNFSPDGREITLYRLFEMDICIITASCAMPNLQMDITIEAEKDTEFWLIPAEVYRGLMEESVVIANYTNDLMNSRFSEVMWLMEQIMWKSFDKRLAGFLLQESAIEGSLSLRITHEKIANHMGTAREVVTRMLRYFQNEGMVRLTRGTVEITDEKKLQAMQEE